MEAHKHEFCKELEKMLLDDFQDLVETLLGGDRKSLISGTTYFSKDFADIVSRVCFLNHKLRMYEQSKEYCDNKIMSTPLDECFFQIRTVNALKKDGINYIHELINKTEYELSITPNIGELSLKDIKEVLGEMNLCLRQK